MAAGFTAGIAGRATSINSPFESDGIRTHVLLLLCNLVIWSPLVPYIDAMGMPSANFQQGAIETGFLVVIAYMLGVIGSYVGDWVQDLGVF